MADFTAGAVLTAAQLDTAFNTFTINAQTGTTYTLGAADAGELVTVNNNSGGTVTIPANATTAYETGTHIAIMNAGTAGTFTVAGAGGVTLNAESTTLASKKAATLVKTATNTWYMLPFSSGGSAAPVVDEANSTGVTFSTLTNPDGDGKNYRLASMTSNCTLKVDTAGYAQVMLIGGGSGSSGSPVNNWGGGGAIIDGLQLIPAGTHSVVIGGAGAASNTSTGSGGATKIGSVIALNTGIMAQTGTCSRSTSRPANINLCYASSITGSSIYYGIAQDSFTTANGSSVPRANRGDGGGQGASTAGAGSTGVAYIRWEV